MTRHTVSETPKPHVWSAIAALMWLLLVAVAVPVHGKGLDEYVSRPDPAYTWSMYHEKRGWLARYYFLELTSQQWLEGDQVDRPIWTHELRVVQPRNLLCGRVRSRTTTAILIVSGGRNKPDVAPADTAPVMATMVARAFCRPVVQLRQVPNQPLHLAGDRQGRTEDALITASFARYLRAEPGDWPVQLAMVKSVVQAMHAVQEFSRARGDMAGIEDFVLLGASKRGWTAWLAAAVDPRVRAVIPVSIDMPNLPRQFEHHISAYGGYARALGDYGALDIGCRLRSPRGKALLELVDPYAYRERLTMPKLILNSAGDEFFVPDAWRFYFDDLPGLASLRYTVNTGHDQGDAAERLALFRAAANWVDNVLDGDDPPQLRWHVDDGALVVEASEAPRKVRLWTADNPAARDFRLETLGPVWRSQSLTPDADGRYRVQLAEPARGWRATLVEATFGGWRQRTHQVQTTGVFVTPERMPFDEPQCEVQR